jgi:hypothetical protein
VSPCLHSLALLPRLGLARATLVIVLLASRAAAQSAPDLTATARWNPDQYLASRAPLRFELSRPLATRGERLGVVIGDSDVSALVDIDGREVRFSPDRLRLPVGASEAVVYLVRADREWIEVARAPLRVRTRAGLDEQAWRPSVELSSTGPVARGDPRDAAPIDRGTFQDLTVRLGIDGAFARDAWRLTTQGNAVAVSEPTQRLRFGDLQTRAPALDLSDYAVRATRGTLALSLGHQSAGQHRLLANGFSSRGLGGAVRLGPIAAVDVALLNGTSIAGWGNALGVHDPRHRVATAGMSLELIPSRPGALHVHVAGVDGSLLPRTGFTQAAVTDAEQSQGGGLRVAMSDIDQRIRFEGGYARSRFTNPIDPLLADDPLTVAVRAETRAARYGELAIDLLRNAPITSALPATLGVIARHERTDPLYRSIATSVQPDRDMAGVDVTGALGPLSLQGSMGTARDNLQRIASVLTTRTRQQSMAATLPLGARCGASLCPLPNMHYARERAHQIGDDVPVNGEFEPSHVPDQVSINQTATLGWTVAGRVLEYRWNESRQDNRQPGREAADFTTTVHALTLGGGSFGALDLGLDASRELQRNVEIAATQRLDRLGGTVRWQPWRGTDVLAVLSHAWGAQPADSLRTRNLEFQFELSRGFDLYRRFDGGTQGRAWLRFARTRAAVLPLLPQPLLNARISWTLVVGGSFRLY